MPSRGRSRLTSREALVLTALALIDDLGLRGLTIRELAARAGVSPMTIYTYFKNKEQLQEALYAEVSSRLWADSWQTSWQAEFRAWCQHLHRLFVEHPRWRPLFFRRDFHAPGSLRERLVGLMLSDGFAAPQASEALMVAGLLSLGFAIIETDFRDADGRSIASHHFAGSSPRQDGQQIVAVQPLKHAAAGQPINLDVGKYFRLAVELSILGLEATDPPREPGSD